MRLLFIFLLFSLKGVAQVCNVAAPVTYTISQTAAGEIYRPNGVAWKGGDTLKITGTNYSVIEFFNIGGDSCRPLVIMPADTLRTVQFRFKGNSRYIKLWGGANQYGLKVMGGSLAIASSHHIEVDNVECGFGSIGVFCKQDVSYSDTMTWHPNYRMTKFTFKNMWVHDINGEGMYIGITLPNAWPVTSTYSGLDTLIRPIRLDSVEIYNCLVERTQWDGIQVSNARNGCKIYNNTVKNYGILNMGSQQAGIIMGGNTNGVIYNNTVRQGTGNGIQVFGFGVINVYNNLLDSCGSTNQESIFSNDFISTVETNAPMQLNIYSNTIKHYVAIAAVRIANYNGGGGISSINNNAFRIPGATTGWEATRLLISPVGSTVYDNTLIVTTSIFSNRIKGRRKYRN